VQFVTYYENNEAVHKVQKLYYLDPKLILSLANLSKALKAFEEFTRQKPVRGKNFGLAEIHFAKSINSQLCKV
jgi:hypothetical protein